ncbi:MAG: methyltransferase domain-containing protein [Actinomycetota bacterium]
MSTAELRDVLRCLVDASAAEAAALVRRVPTSPLAEALAPQLDAAAEGGVYDEPTGFDVFISEGSNPTLYAATIDRLTTVHAAVSPSAVLDVGCGDGRVTAGVVAPGTVVTLVEPSAALLAEAESAVVTSGASVTAFTTGIDTHLDGLDADIGWDLVQSTFALHTLEPTTRATVLADLAERTGRLAMIDFDVPDLDPTSDAWLSHLVNRYEIGVAEYTDHREAVDGFLVPVLLGQLDPDRPRHTFEQPAVAWAEQLEAAGFIDVRIEPVADYWWAPAFLIQANGRR